MRSLLPILALACVAGCKAGPGTPSSVTPVPTGATTLAMAGTPSLGPTVTPGGVSFRVWAPHARAAAVAGSFPGGTAAMSAVGDGTFAATVPGARAGDTFHYTLTTDAGSLTRLDPYCRELMGSECKIVDSSAYAWKSGTFRRPTREQSVVYELHIGSFAVPAGTAQGTFASVAQQMSTLADLGVNVVELMPVQDFGKSGHSWGYGPQLYLAPQPAYGSADDLRALVDAAHGQGIGVWLDVVYNHYSGSSAAPLRCFDGDCPAADAGDPTTGPAGIYFLGPGAWAGTPWGPRLDFAAPQVAGMIRASLAWWLGEMRGDGFRWDSVSNIRGDDGHGSAPGGRDLLVAGNAIIHAAGAMSVAEDLKGYAAITAPASQGGFGFDAQWDGFGYMVTRVLVAPSDAARDLGEIEEALTRSYNGDPFRRLIFLEDHDTVGNGGSQIASLIDPQSPESWKARKLSMLGGVLLLTAPGVPMLFQGQDTLASGTFADRPAPLPAPDAAGLLMRGFYHDAIRLRRNLVGKTGALAEAGIRILHRNDAAKIIAYHRTGPSGQDVIVIVNLMNKAYATYDVGAPSAGPWRVRLDTEWKAYGPDLGGGQTGPILATATPYDDQPCKLEVALGAYSAVVLSR